MSLKTKSPNNHSTLFFGIYEGNKSLPLMEYLKETAQLSGRSLRQYFFKGLVQLNSRRAHSGVILKAGDQVLVTTPNSERQTLTPETGKLNVIYEDRQLLILNKPAQLATHPSGKITHGTLANQVAAYLNAQGEKLKVRPVNRLDFGTSGLVIFAKNAFIQAELSKAIQAHQIIRTYYAVVQGIPQESSGEIELPIATSQKKRIVDQAGKPAVTNYLVKEVFTTNSLLELTLETGRTHQIRVHLEHLGYPLLGDSQYGVKSPFFKRPALHAGKLNFTASKFDVPELIAAFPDDFEKSLLTLRQNSTP